MMQRVSMKNIFKHDIVGNLKIAFLLLLMLLLGDCKDVVTYKLEILKSPVGLVALEKTSPFNYTELDFYAYNIETDFSGYNITVGATQSDALQSVTYSSCLFSTNSNLNKPTKIQLGGASALTGYDCYISGLGPLVPATWVSVMSFSANRDCTKYPDSGCSANSDPASAEVLPYVAPLTTASIQYLVSPDAHYVLTVSMAVVPANLTGLGLFYSPNRDEAESKAAEDPTIFDGFCPLTAASVTPGADLLVQIGGTQIPGMNCYIGNFYLHAGDILAVRNSSNGLKYPWSDFVSVTIP